MTSDARPPRTYWLSFADDDGFRGALVVDVPEHETVAAWLAHPDMADPDNGPWIAAACRLAHRAQVNPGGEVLAIRIDDHPAEAVKELALPRLQLLSKAELEQNGLSLNR